MKSYSLQEIQKLWWAGQIKRCLECVKGKVIHTGNSPQGGWVAYYTCDCCGTNYEYQDSDMGQTLPSLRSNADENPNLLKIKQEVVRMKFKDAPIGARFKYPNSDAVWVKLNSYPKSSSNDGNGLVCSWEGNVKGMQSFCSFSDEEENIDFDTEVELI